MLTAIREKVQGIIAGIIVTLIIIPFALWGTYSYFEGGSDIHVAEVEGVKISQRNYRLALERLLGRNVDPAVLENPVFKKQVLDGLIDQTLMAQNAAEQGYRVGDTVLGRMIRETPQFQREGRFDPSLYETLLRRDGLSQQAFEERVRATQVNTQILSGLTESALMLEREEAALLRLWQQRRDFDYVVVDPSHFRGSVQVSDDDIKQYYESHTDEFKTPEQVRIEYIRLAADELAGNYAPTEEELRKAYAQETARYTTPEKRRVSHILIKLPADASEEQEKKAMDKAREIEQELKQGADFALLAKKHSADAGTAADGGDLGYVERGMLPPTLENAVFTLQPNAISEPVRTSDGYHIAKLTEYTPAARAPFEETRADLEKLLRQRHGEEQFYEKFEDMSNVVYEQPDSLAPAAEILGLKIMHSEWFDRNGGTGIAAQPQVVQAAFSPDVLVYKRNSDAIEIGRDTLLALRVIEHREAALKPLTEVSDRIRVILREQRAREKAVQLGTKLAEELRAGVGLAQLAEREGLKVQQAKSITRLKPQGVDRRVVNEVFKARRPKAGESVYGDADLGENGYVVFGLTNVEQGDAEQADDALKERVERELMQREANTYYTNYVQRLRETADIKVYADRL